MSLSGAKRERVEMAAQSLIVSQVAAKLEQHARKAFKGQSSTASWRTRCGGGRVTPPYGISGALSGTKAALVTYDDENYGYESDPDSGAFGPPMIQSSSSVGSSGGGVITESEASSMSGGEDSSSFVMTEWEARSSPTSSISGINNDSVPPANGMETVEDITQRLMNASSELVFPIVVARFCMLISPLGDKLVGTKILQLMANCEALSNEFQNYRSALHQPNFPKLTSTPAGLTAKCHHGPTLEQIWERDVSRSEAIRDFSIFAVNCLHQILAVAQVVPEQQHYNNNIQHHPLGSSSPFSSTTIFIRQSDRAILERTADLWLSSVTGLVAA